MIIYNKNNKIYSLGDNNNDKRIYFKLFSNYHLGQKLKNWDFKEYLIILKDQQIILSFRLNFFLEQLELHKYDFDNRKRQYQPGLNILKGQMIFEDNEYKLEQLISIGIKDDQDIFIVLQSRVLIFNKQSLKLNEKMIPEQYELPQTINKTNKKYQSLIIQNQLFLFDQTVFLKDGMMIILVSVFSLQMKQKKIQMRMSIKQPKEFPNDLNLAIQPKIFHVQQNDSLIELFVCARLDERIMFSKIECDQEFNVYWMKEQLIRRNYQRDPPDFIQTNLKINDFQEDIEQQYF